MTWINYVLYNAQHADVDRVEEISLEFANHDIVLIVGTGQQAWAGREDAEQSDAAHHRVFNFYFKKSKLVNKSCGLAILAGRKVRNVVSKTFTPPPSLGITGRVAAVRFKSAVFDILVVLQYFYPPTPHNAPTVTKTAGKIEKWTTKLIDGMGSRVFVLVAGDINGGFGIRKNSFGQTYTTPTR